MSKGTLFPHLTDDELRAKLDRAECEIARLQDIGKIRQKQVERLMAVAGLSGPKAVQSSLTSQMLDVLEANLGQYTDSWFYTISGVPKLRKDLVEALIAAVRVNFDGRHDGLIEAHDLVQRKLTIATKAMEEASNYVSSNWNNSARQVLMDAMRSIADLK
jgi:hypothetical protein